MNRIATADRFAAFGTTIFSEMSALAQRHGAINLAQGFPDFDGPGFIAEAASRAIDAGHNQYARSMGHPQLVEAIGRKVERFYGLKVDPLSEVIVFSGATEGIAASVLGLVNPGDEVILFEPYYDSYRACVSMAGGVPRYCPLRLPDFTFDAAELQALFSEKTRLVILNSPHNPTGRVFNLDELEIIAEACRRWDVIALTDEVYEHIVFGDARHIPLSTLPGMYERTLSLSSTGKTFSMTGWKIGYGVGPAHLVAAAQAAHQFLTFSTATPFQLAMAEAIDAPDAFYEGLTADYRARRDMLVEALSGVGLDVKTPQGTYFALVDISGVGVGDDRAFTRHLIEEVGVACIPTSAFYSQAVEEGRQLVRFAFCKTEPVLREAAQRLRRLL